MRDTTTGLRRWITGGGGLALVAAGVLGIAPPASATTSATLFEEHEGTTAADFGKEGSCPDLEPGQDGWHFVLRGNVTTFESVTASFDSNKDGIADTDVIAPGPDGTVGPPTAKHAYVYTPTGWTLVTATAVVNGPEVIFNLSHTCPGGPVQPRISAPQVNKTASTAYTKVYDWDVDKNVDKSFVTSIGTTHTANYTIDVTKSGPELTGFAVAGTITITNPNAQFDLEISDVTDLLGDDPDITCLPDPLFAVPLVLAPSELVAVNYGCQLPDTTSPTLAGTNEVEVEWSAIDDPNPEAVYPKIRVSDPVEFDFADATVTKVNDCADLTDSLKGDLGEFCASDAVQYALDFDVPARGCATYDNTATVTFQTGSKDDSAEVEVCRPNNEGGFTIGYWQNKNGQDFIKANRPAVTSAINTYYYKNATAPVEKFVLDIVKADVTKNNVAMLDKQYLATILSTVKSPELLDTCIQVGPHGVMSVKDFLLEVKANYAFIAADDLHREGVKNIFDSLNNNQQPVYACG